ncbi:hypothetical protein a10_07451 [Streptomyces acidiscabies]|nr:hypothetical protein a10_07451 [Streptomyces acidiscabies]GAV44127.1 hypothetical protein Saa2_07087 [Streptomyces acidiscabies]
MVHARSKPDGRRANCRVVVMSSVWSRGCRRRSRTRAGAPKPSGALTRTVPCRGGESWPATVSTTCSMARAFSGTARPMSVSVQPSVPRSMRRRPRRFSGAGIWRDTVVWSTPRASAAVTGRPVRDTASLRVRNRPSALNALTIGMVAAIDRARGVGAHAAVRRGARQLRVPAQCPDCRVPRAGRLAHRRPVHGRRSRSVRPRRHRARCRRCLGPGSGSSRTWTGRSARRASARSANVCVTSIRPGRQLRRPPWRSSEDGMRVHRSFVVT